MKEQIDIVNITRSVLRYWFYILVVSLIAALLAGTVSVRGYQPRYRTQALIAVYGRTSYGGVVYDAQDTADVFQEVITSNLLQKKVAEEMGIPSLPGSLSCENIPYTNMITLTVTAASPRDAMTVMNGVLEHHNVVTYRLLGDMVLQILEEPTVPTAPVEAYNGKEILTKAFSICLIASCAILFFLFYMRDDIKNEAQVEKKLDTKLFATVYHEDIYKGFGFLRPKSKKRGKGILVTNQVTSFGFTETFQKMGMRLIYKAKEKDVHSILVTSLQENEGKSTVAVNLALSLAKMGKRVMLIDLDLRKPAVYKLLEIAYKKEDEQIGDLLAGKASLKDTVHRINGVDLLVLAGNRSYPNSINLLNKKAVGELVRGMRKYMDYVIIDTPPIDAVADAEEIMRYAEAGLLVIKQNGAVAKDINDTIDIFRNTDCTLLGCILNNVQTGFIGSRILGREGYNNRYQFSGHYDQ